MRIIGLTGGIATGKTTAANLLWQQHGVTLVDADLLARAAVVPGSIALAAIVDRYGPTVCQADGQLDRTQLGAIVFGNPDERAWLESQIHPYVVDRLVAEVASARAAGEGAIVLVVPLLFEADLVHLVTEVWVVTCTRDQQCDRLMARNGLTRAEAEARLASQWPIEQKCDRANWVLDNSGPPEALADQVDQAWRGVN